MTVGAVAAVAAYLLSDRRQRGRNAAIAGAAGCGVGMGVNHYVQTRRSQYADGEQRLQVMIQDVRQDNERLEGLIDTTRQVVSEDRKRIAEIDAAYGSNEISVAQARSEMRAVVDNRNHLRQTLEALRQKEREWKQISIYERHSGIDTRALDIEIQELRRNISTIEEELAVIEQEISVSPVAA
jgi:chromosome segregation ATPase